MTQVKAIDTTLIRKARQEILANFFNVEPVVERLEMFIAMNEIAPRTGNVIFYGKGGYGKTEIVQQFLKTATGVDPFVVNINQATTPADIFGGMDIDKFSKGDGIDYLFDNSFMNHEWVIFEEGLEARQKVLSALKYIITSGVFAAAGTQSRPIKTKGIVIVTNVDTADFMDSDDTKAFIERFRITYKVGWEGLNQSARLSASINVVNKFDVGRQLTDYQRRIIAENTTVRLESPRTIAGIVQAMLARQAMNGGGMVSEQTFLTTMDMMGFGDKNLAAKIEEERIAREIQDAKTQYETLFEQLNKNLVHYKGLKSHIGEPKYIVKLAKQISSTMRLISDIQNSIVDIRTNPNYGNKGNELASWINAKIGEFDDQLEEIKKASYDGLLLTVEQLVEKMEAEGIAI